VLLKLFGPGRSFLDGTYQLPPIIRAGTASPRH
jgi:hypothetical protein